MKEIDGNIWDFVDQQHWIVVTTNGTIKSNRELVMGKGIALEAKNRYSGLALELGIRTAQGGNHCYLIWGQNIITFPTKHNWFENSDLQLIERSAKEFINITSHIDAELKRCLKPSVTGYYLPRPGCGNGGLSWDVVKPVLEKYFIDDRIIIVSQK